MATAAGWAAEDWEAEVDWEAVDSVGEDWEAADWGAEDWEAEEDLGAGATAAADWAAADWAAAVDLDSEEAARRA